MPRARLRRALLAALVAGAVAVPVSGAARPGAVPAPAPAALPPLGSATPAALEERYAATREDILAAGRAAERAGHRRRAGNLREMADPGRRFLSFDGRDGGRTVEVFGDLSRAERVAVLVPGSDTALDTYGRLLDGATRLRAALGGATGLRAAPGETAVIAWLGYRTPATLSTEVLTAARADEGAPALREFVRTLRRLRPDAGIALLCHSYGSVVCGRAAPGLDVNDIVLYGSGGVGVDTVAALRTRATVWAGRAGGDWVAAVPHTRIVLPFAMLGFGADPVTPGFGARIFAAGDGGHSDYLKEGSLSLAGLAAIVSGRAPAEVGGHA
ncbi:alpha/beta hydrolase [Nonomuraea sp. NPDC050691]|uniref:alpha/beta hydrolase n=1 Tax=Nonomuraea sp. NPDC050691 TaxID=3155661 RepID=UPI0034051EB3